MLLVESTNAGAICAVSEEVTGPPSATTDELAAFRDLHERLSANLSRLGLDARHSDLAAIQMADAWSHARQIAASVEEVASAEEPNVQAFGLAVDMESFDDDYLWFMEGVFRAMRGLLYSRQDEARLAEPEVRAWWRDASTLSAAAAAAVKLKHRNRRAASRLTLLGLIELARDALPGKARRRFRRTVADVYESSAALLALMERRQRGRSSRSR